MKRTFLSLLALVSVLTLSAQSVYDFKVKDDTGKEVSLAKYKGKVLLIVNTATRCGFTPQYNELQALYEKYQGEGLEILDFPCNQFGQQAPGTIEEIHEFCSANFNIKFPQFDKIDVNGANEHPLYTYLKSQKGFGGFDLNDKTGKLLDDMMRKRDANYDKNSDIKWNFTKFLVSADGRVLKRYEPTDKMADIEADVLMEVNPVLSNIMARRSIRKYLDKPVEHAKLEIVVRAGINAPSAVNRQPWIVRVVEDQKLIADVTEVYKEANAEMVKRDKDFKNMFRNAPNLICVCTPANGGGELDAGLLGENMMLAAQSIGLGTCCLGGPVRFLLSNEKCKFFLDRLDIPEGYKLNYILAIGYPDEQPAAKPRDASKVKYLQKAQEGT
ncbi:nitroreductase family protein [Xylanibacter ruminicola]|uniref:Glutathione peroxidase n=1 Tax=Xylanibacter ruminicola TaxID=839 RepID=A0A1M6V1F5_XYLRU|nr:Glutathione peroxidase, house-cleaning role in reducing lipid peroxides [Xylanibacter ruminicola]